MGKKSYVKDWGSVRAPQGDSRVRPSDVWEMYKIPPKHRPVRPIGPVAVMAEHWIEIEGKRGPVRIGVPCPNFDPETEAPTRDGGCPACAAGYRLTLRYFTNVIDRRAQRAMRGNVPMRRSKDDDPYLDASEQPATPVKVLSIPVSVMRTIRELEEDLNVVDGKVYPVNHPKYGRDLLLRFKESASPSEMYSVSLSAGHTPLTKEERRYKIWDLSKIEEVIGDPEDNRRRLEELLEKAIDLPGEGEETSGKKDKKETKKKKARPVEDEDDFDVPEDDVIDADEEEDEDLEEEEDDLEDLEDRIYEMSRKELKQFIKERKLNIKVKKSMSDDDIRDAILEELGLI